MSKIDCAKDAVADAIENRRESKLPKDKGLDYAMELLYEIKPITEHPDVQRLVGQVAELQIKSHELQDENERVKHLTEARFNDWLIAKGQIRELQAENERLKKAIKRLSLGEYTDALSEGCDANGAFDCLCEAIRNWKDEALKGNQ